MTRGVPSHETREGWWYHASQEEKLAQVDAAIAFGLSSNWVARNCGALSGDTVGNFANWHGRTFQEAAEVRAIERSEKRRRRKLTAREQKALLRRAYFSGDPVDFAGWPT